MWKISNWEFGIIVGVLLALIVIKLGPPPIDGLVVAVCSLMMIGVVVFGKYLGGEPLRWWEKLINLALGCFGLGLLSYCYFR